MGDGMLSLSWNNHSSTFCHMLATLRDVERFTDVTITCEGKFYPVHKLVLSTCSDYFQKIFECTPCKHPVIVLKDIHCKDIEALLSYMYAGVVSVAQKDLAQLIKAAELLQIKGLAVPDEPPQNSRRMFAGMEDMCGSESKRHKRHCSMNGENELTVVGGMQMSPDGSSSHKEGEQHLGSSGQRGGHRQDQTNARDDGDGDDNDDDRVSQTLEQGLDDDISGQEICAHVETVVEDTLVKEELVADCSDTELTDEGFDYSALTTSLMAENKQMRGREQMGHMLLEKYDHMTHEQAYHVHQQGSDVQAGPSLLQGWPGLGDIGEGSTAGHSYCEDVTSPIHQGLQHSLVGPNSENQRSSDSENMGLGKILASVTQLRQFHHHPFSNAERDSTYRPGGSCGRKKVKKPFSCAQCSYQTASKSNLVIHLRTHTGERPYQCPQCSFSASFEYNLKVHMRTHTGEKPYMCPNCPLRFAQKAHLKNHLFTHTGEKPFSCQHCSAKFSRMSNLRRHSQTHQ
ncbi:oocyte zinc finger protein XlCOF7.1-like [Penaeus japonicus]|uniref:oocyte zinc finger protein XlCOF7.1-like n=1 Tax=Penaeus japonicus TaxID=27405 RepID=UPI001C712E94|nr:oocyte zinc finger protein XlCOF7.1-like [Penaeus japonicus]